MGYTVIVLVVFGGFVFFGTAVIGTDSEMMAKSRVTFSSDASDITWAHAVNSRESLERELAGSADFLEADVTLGLLEEEQFGHFIPIMAHPPHNISDISLEMWIDAVIERNAGKGVKLDFKSISVVEPSLKILQTLFDKVNFTLWLNADILNGPIHASTIPVKDELFLLLCHQYFPYAVLSVGWTTNWYSSFPQEFWHYEWMHVRKMADTIRCFGYEKHYPSFTFPVRGIFASRSIKQLQWLLGVVPGSFLTVWTAEGDPLDVHDLLTIRKSFPIDKVYYDIPEDLNEQFSKMKSSTTYVPKTHSSFSPDQWMSITHGQIPECRSYTYVSNNTIVFGKSLTTAVLLKKLISVDDDHSLQFEGRVEFFSSYEQRTSSFPRNYDLKIVIVDVSLFSKNSSKGSLDLTESDTDVLWSAVNASELHRFRQNATDHCRVFKLDSDRDQSFQAWTVPCNELNDEFSFEDIVKDGVKEIPFRKRLILPATPFMIGFVFSGDGHAVIHDFKLGDDKEMKLTSASSAIKVSVALLSVLFMSFAVRRLMQN